MRRLLPIVVFVAIVLLVLSLRYGQAPPLAVGKAKQPEPVQKPVAPPRNDRTKKQEREQPANSAPAPTSAFASASVSGRVFDKATNAGLGGVLVSAYFPLQDDTGLRGYGDEKAVSSGVTGDDGAYAIPNLVPGKYVIIRGQPKGFDAQNPLEYPMVVLAAGEARAQLDLPAERGITGKGRVVNEAGEPIEFARVQAGQMRRAMQTQITDEKGEFSLYGLVVDWPVFFTISAPGYSKTNFHRAAGSEQKYVPTAEGLDAGDFTLQQGATVSGTLVDESGAPQSEVEVSFQGRSGNDNTTVSTKTDASGAFTAEDVAVGANMVTIHEDDAARERKGRWLELLEQTSATLQPGNGNTPLQLVCKAKTFNKYMFSVTPSEVKPNMTTGYIVDERGEPLAGVEIQEYVELPDGFMGCGNELIGRPFCTSNADGFWGVDLGKTGTLTLGAGNREVGGRLFPGIKAGSKNNRLVMRDPAVVSGHVVDAATGAPITRFTIKWDPLSMLDGGDNLSDPAGRFSLTIKYPKAKLSVTAEGHSALCIDVKDTYAESAKNLTIALSSGCILRGVVRDEHGQPRQYARVSGRGNEMSTTGPDGAYELRQLDPGPQDIFVSTGEYASIMVNLTLVEGVPATRDFTLTPTATVRGHVDPALLDNRPDTRFLLEVDGSARHAELRRRDETCLVADDGTFVFERVTPGNYVIRVDTDGDRRPETYPVSVAAGETVDVEIP